MGYIAIQKENRIINFLRNISMKIIAVTLFILGLTIHQGTYAENSDVTIVIDGKVYTTKDSLPSGSRSLSR